MINPLTQKTFIALCKLWTDVINTGESGIQMWAPISGAHIRIKQFLTDKELQKQLFSTDKQQLLFVDANEIANFSFEDFERQVLGKLRTSEAIGLDAYLKVNGQKLVIFFTGLDTAIKEENRDVLKKLGGLLQTYTHFSLLLFVEFDVLNEMTLQHIAVKSPFVQNIFYAELYKYEDSIQFFAYLEEKWHCIFDKKKTEALAKKIGGQFWLLKEAARILRANPSFSPEEVLNTTTLFHKGLTLFALLDEQDQRSVYSLLQGNPPVKISDYLLKTGLVENHKLSLSYWYYIKKDISDHYSQKGNHKTAVDFDVYFTATERDVFELLLDENGIVSREAIAKTLWQENWEERYSDWAIDQIIHRLREKMLLANAPYQIITKKGEGFVITAT